MKVIYSHDNPKSAKGGSTFTGDVHLFASMESQDGIAINNVNFSPGARTFWHRHENGQVLIVLAGRGWVQNDSGSKNVIGAGDTVWVQPGELHWHGATDGSYMVHKAISLGETNWGDEVTTEQYRSDAETS